MFDWVLNTPLVRVLFWSYYIEMLLILFFLLFLEFSDKILWNFFCIHIPLKALFSFVSVTEICHGIFVALIGLLWFYYNICTDTIIGRYFFKFLKVQVCLGFYFQAQSQCQLVYAIFCIAYDNSYKLLFLWSKNAVRKLWFFYLYY